MSAVLVTGGAGYIGSHAVRALVRAGHVVIVLDDLSAGHRDAARATEFIEGDVRDTALVRAMLRRHRVDAVMHFAGWLSVADSVRDPVGYYHTNVIGTLSILAAMVAESVSNFVFSSSAAVYGQPKETPIAESHPIDPINTYGETKRAVERALPHYTRAYGLRWIALRYFNAAGADPDADLGEDHDPEEHLIPRAIEAARGGQPLQVFGLDYPTPDGTCLRDYVHVSDLADAHVLALDTLRAGAAPTVYNLGNGRPASVREVIAGVERVSGRTVPWSGAPRRPGDPTVLFASSERIRRELGWRPRFEDLDTIIATAWRWHEARPLGFATQIRRS